jgi:hypothetical protein
MVRPVTPLVILLAACGVTEYPRSALEPPPPLDASVLDLAPGVDAPPPGVEIDGVFVPREKALVVIHIGHSNMAGRAANPASLHGYFYDLDPHLWSYHHEDPIGGTGPIAFRPASEPLAGDASSEGHAGPGMALLRSLLARAPDAHVISIGRGQSGAAQGLCQSFVRGGLLYEHFMRPARALKGNVTFVGVFTMLGANEFWNGDTAGFSDCLRQIAIDVRGDLDEPALPFLYGDFEMSAWGQYLPTLPGPAAVIAQLRLVPGKVPRSALIPTEELPLEDDHHFNLQGHKTWAERAITILHERGWAPWESP